MICDKPRHQPHLPRDIKGIAADSKVYIVKLSTTPLVRVTPPSLCQPGLTLIFSLLLQSRNTRSNHPSMAAELIVPIEVFEAIIDQATDCTESLRRLSLACRVFLPRVRYHLFSNIVIRSVEKMDVFCAFLDDHSWAPALVRKVTLAMVLNYDPCTPTMRLLDVAPTHLLSRLPNLRGWRMEVAKNDCGPKGQPILLSPHRSALSCYERHGGRIQHLELSNVCFDDVSDFKALVLAFTGIYSLSCSHIRFRTTTATEAHGDGASPNGAITQPRLKRLRVSTSHHFSGCTMKELTQCEYDDGCQARHIRRHLRTRVPAGLEPRVARDSLPDSLQPPPKPRIFR